jgi:hypothetical protein
MTGGASCRSQLRFEQLRGASQLEPGSDGCFARRMLTGRCHLAASSSVSARWRSEWIPLFVLEDGGLARAGAFQDGVG